MTFDLSILQSINPTGLAYQDWLAVGMAIKHEGGSASDWDTWSKRDTRRYRPGDCFHRWEGFNGGNGTQVTGGTIVELAKQQGWTPPKREGRAFDWNDTVNDSMVVIDKGWVEEVEVAAPGADWNQADELIKYLSTLFESNDYVGYVTEAWLREGEDKWFPKKGSYTRTAGELIQELSQHKEDICAVIGDYNPEAGAWIRFNPLDGKGVSDSNVTAYKYTLVECDNGCTIEQQAALYKAMELPVAAIATSGNKSLHAIVRVDAKDKAEYRERVNYLHEVCRKNGIEIDGANKNPSRLSRMPGVYRNGQKQYLVATNQGKESWEEWKRWIEEANDNLPDIENLSDVFSNLPELANPLIDGILREGHKMLLAGPSKAGKSYILLQLAISIAEGKPWLGWPCAQGKILYVNLELDRASCLHRLKLLYQSLGWNPENVSNIDIWNLRGKATPMDALAPKLIRRALQKRYKAVIIDPIYKVITGDENAADKMAHFCNQFDRVCTELGCAVIYCHHHSKGTQGQKSSIDRSSGSGVFARDPDAIIDLIELQITDARREQIRNREVCNALKAALDQTGLDWQEGISQDDALIAPKMVEYAATILGDAVASSIYQSMVDPIKNMSGWRMEGTLREFAPFDAKRFFFRYPVHVDDVDGVLKDALAEGELPARKPRSDKDTKKDSQEALEAAFNSIAAFGEDGEGTVTIEELANYLGISEKTVRNKFSNHPSFVVSKGEVMPKHIANQKEVECVYQELAQIAEQVTVKEMADKLKITEKTVRNKIKSSLNLNVDEGVVTWAE